MRTAIPRGLKSFVVRGVATSAKPINDDYLLGVTFTLPGGFGYVFNECHMNISVNVANDFEGFSVLSLFQSSAANKDFDYRQPIAMELGGINGSSNSFRFSRVPAGTLTRTPIVPRAGGSNGIFSYTNRQDTAGAAGVVDVLISFFEYDLEQLAWYPAHSVGNVATR